MNFLNKLGKIILNFITVLIFILVIIVIYNFIQIRILNKSFCNFFGYTFFQVETGSMSGAIEIDDIIVIKITQDVHKDDIITFINNNEIVTHRIISENGDELITKGDANNSEDEAIKREQVIGKVVKIFNNLGVWLKVFTDIKVILCVIVTIVFVGLALASDEKNTRGKINEKKKEEKE